MKLFNLGFFAHCLISKEFDWNDLGFYICMLRTTHRG